jgi:hypothetical protein
MTTFQLIGGAYLLVGLVFFLMTYSIGRPLTAKGYALLLPGCLIFWLLGAAYLAVRSLKKRTKGTSYPYYMS